MKKRLNNLILKVIIAAMLVSTVPVHALTVYAEDGYTDETLTDEPSVPGDPNDPSGEPSDPGVPLESIVLSEESLTLIKGKTASLTVSYFPEDTTADRTVTWESSDTTVATVSTAGKITAKKAGEVTITAMCGEASAICTVTVKEIPLRKITLSKTSLTLLKGKTKKLTVSYTPSDTTDSKKVTFTSSNKKVATVSSSGKITAKKAGKATITAKCGTKKATCKVTVKEIHLKSIKLNKSSKVVDKGTTFQLKVTYSPANTTDSKKVTYTSSNKKVATVNSKGKITAKNYGTAVITAKCGSKKATCKITIKNGYESVTKAYTELNNFRTGGKVWYWDSDDKTKVWFNTKESNTLTKLKRDKALEESAKIRAKDLIKNFAHYRPNGDVCFTVYPDDLWGYGENIAYGYSTATEVTDAWKEDNFKFAGQGHRRNMLCDSFNVVGIACYQYNGRKYWVQCFGYRPE